MMATQSNSELQGTHEEIKSLPKAPSKRPADFLTATRILPKLIGYFVDHPNTEIHYRALVRNIQEDGGASWRYVKELVKVGLLIKSPSKLYSLDKSFVLLPEFNVMYSNSNGTRVSDLVSEGSGGDDDLL